MMAGKQELALNGNNAAKGSLRLFWLYGVAFTFIIAYIGVWIAKLPGFSQVGSMACSLIIAVMYRQLFGYPQRLRLGIQFAAKKLLRYAIVLFGLKLNIDVIFREGLGLLARDLGVIIFSIIMMMLIARWLKADLSIAFLLAIGTGICGASAIATVSSIVKSKEEDTAISVGIIAVMGTMFAVGYTILRPYLSLSATDYGIWTGISLHEIAHVVLAAAPAGQDGLAIALLAKLGRVFFLIPLSFILVYWLRKKGNSAAEGNIEFPWFLIGFVIMSLIGTYVIDSLIAVPKGIQDYTSSSTAFILTMAMVGLGLNVSFTDLRSRAMRPLLAISLTSLLLSIGAFFIV